MAWRNTRAVLLEELQHDNELKRVTTAWQQRCRTLVGGFASFALQNAKAGVRLQEETIVNRLHNIWKSFSTYRMDAQAEQEQHFAHMLQAVAAFSPAQEWTNLEKKGITFDPAAPPRQPADLRFPGQDDPACKPIKEGVLERKRRCRFSCSFLRLYSTQL